MLFCHLKLHPSIFCVFFYCVTICASARAHTYVNKCAPFSFIHSSIGFFSFRFLCLSRMGNSARLNNGWHHDHDYIYWLRVCWPFDSFVRSFVRFLLKPITTSAAKITLSPFNIPLWCAAICVNFVAATAAAAHVYLFLFKNNIYFTSRRETENNGPNRWLFSTNVFVWKINK